MNSTCCRHVPAWIIALLAFVTASALPRAASAGADFFTFDAPANVPSAEAQAESQQVHVMRSSHFGERPRSAGAEAYAAQGQGVIYVWWAEGGQTGDPTASIRSAFDAILQGPELASPHVGSAQIDEFQEEVDDDVASIDLAWRHVSDRTVSLVRALAVATGDGEPKLAVAECVMRADAEDDMRPQCEGVLSSLAIATPAGGRAELAALGDPDVPELGETAAGIEAELGELGSELDYIEGDDEATGEGAGDPEREGRQEGGPSLGVPDDGIIHEERERPDSDDDGMPWLLILGAVLVAVAVFATARGRGSDRAEPSEDDERDERDERDKAAKAAEANEDEHDAERDEPSSSGPRDP